MLKTDTFTPSENLTQYLDWTAPPLRKAMYAVGASIALASYLLWCLVFGLEFSDYLNDFWRAVWLLPVVIVTLTAHESVHFVVLRFFAKASDVWFAGWEQGAVVVRWVGPLTKAGYVWSLLAPLVLLSLLAPTLVFVFFPEWRWAALPGAVANGALSAGDVVIAFLTVAKCPRNGLIHGDGNALLFAIRLRPSLKRWC